MNKICTSLEQSKKLLELGIDVNTADMYWLNRPIDLTQIKYALLVVDRSDKHIDFFNSYAVAVEKGEIIPAWSLSALLGLMPIVNDNTYEMGGTLDGGALISHLELTCVMFQEDNPLDAAFKLVVWLKENNKI